jgi:hypothetical protein
MAADRSEVDFSSNTELGSLDNSRQAVGSGIFVEESFTEVKIESRNPSLYLTDSVYLYAGYSESNRAPMAMELTCADPEDPCRLPNAFLSDRPLEQVVAKTWETDEVLGDDYDNPRFLSPGSPRAFWAGVRYEF